MSAPILVPIPNGGFGAYNEISDEIPMEKVDRNTVLVSHRQESVPRILLIDDDQLFCMKMERMAQDYEFPLEQLESLSDVDHLEYWNYDVVILDFDLGETNGVEVARFIEETIGDIPVVLVSNSQRPLRIRAQWPSNVKGFVDKSSGSDTIFESALSVYNGS